MMIDPGESLSVPLPARVLLFALCSFSIPAIAREEVKVHCGIAALPAIKFPFIPGDNEVYHVWGNVGLCLTTIIEGEEENELSLSIKTGFMYDASSYKIARKTGPGRALITNRAGCFLNPEILFPIANKRLKIAAGFGVEYNGYFLAQMDSSEEDLTEEQRRKIADSRRKALAFLSAGLQYDLKNGFSFHVFLRQMLMDAFRGDATLTFGYPPDETKMKLNQIPTILGIGIAYFF